MSAAGGGSSEQKNGPPEKPAFWGKEEQRSDVAFRASHGNNKCEVCDDECRGRNVPSDSEKSAFRAPQTEA